MDVRLPAALQAALEAVARPEARRRAGELSAAYRALQPSHAAVADSGTAAAYATARMPATYAAIVAVLKSALAGLSDFEPRSLLDAGAGPGTASWAAGETFPSLAAITLLDPNRALLALAARLLAASPRSSLAGAERFAGAIGDRALLTRRFDLVVAGYCLTELPDERIRAAALALWAACGGAFVIVEPGRPRDYGRLMAVREALFTAGARMVAPCPHERPCPLPDGDWCHFGVRLPRRRAHLHAKGGSLGYEDEKFSYLVVARPEVAACPVAARVIKPPVVRKFEAALPLCAARGLETRVLARRDPMAFKAARKFAWGDGVTE
jgi:ribosomal protein RSM22 (predicted rRNA methylase)